jgi:predicted glycosyltransferase
VNTDVLFHARNRRGLGHFMRAQNIAAELHQQQPACRIHIHATRPPDPCLLDSSALSISSEADTSWEEMVTASQPQVLVHDTTMSGGGTALSGGTSNHSTKRVLVLRRRSVDQHHALLNDPELRQVSRFIVPHTYEEFGLELHEWMRDRTHFVGPIGRRPVAERAAAVRARLGVGPDDFLITATVGGGGFEQQAERFFEIVAACIPALASTQRQITWLVVLGPNYARPERADSFAHLPNTRAVVTQPRLVDTIAASDLVFAEGGYNTVTEVLLAQTPAVFIPSDRKLDDQRERVERVARTGAAVVVDPQDSLSCTTTAVQEVLADRAAFRALQIAAKSHTIQLGNAQAAAVIGSLLKHRSTLP